jgi:two-component system alkaline phosphatase synthesis response regulator PhoP
MLITDFHMPVLTGMDVCLRLRKQDGLVLPAILLTARGNELSEAELSAAGIVEVVSKPFSPRQLLDAVNRHLKTAA